MDLDFLPNKMNTDLCLKVTALDFTIQINIYNNKFCKNAVEIRLT